MNKPNRLVNFLRQASAGGKTMQRTQELQDRVAGAQNDIYSLNKLANTVKKEEQDAGRNALIQNAKAQGVDLTPNAQGGAKAVYQGKTYELQGPSAGGKPFVPTNPVNVQTLRTQTIETGGPTAKNPMVPVSPRGGNTQTQSQVSASAPVYNSNRPNPSATIQQPKADFSQYTNLTNQVQTPKIPSLTPDQYLKLSPEQQQAYRQMGFQQNVQNQMGGLEQMYGQMGNVFDQRASGIQSEIEQLQSQKDNPQLTEQEKLAIEELQAQKEKAIQLQQQAGQRTAENIDESLSFSGFGRSTKRADLLADNQTNLNTAIADISRKYAEGEASIRTQALERGNKEIERLQARLDKTQDSRDALELDKFSKAFSLQQELFKQDPSNPENMIKVAEQLQTTRIADARLKFDEEKAARQDARQNFQFMVSNYGSQAFSQMSEEELANYASNVGMPVSVIKNMGKTLAEQDKEWDRLKYFDSQEFEMNKMQMQNAYQSQRDLVNFDQEISKISLQLDKDMKLEEFKQKLGDAKSQKETSQLLSALNVNYAKYASGGDKTGLSFSQPVPHPAGGGDVVELNAKIAQAYPDGFRFKASDGPGGLGGQCKWFAQQLTTLANGQPWRAGSTLADTKTNFEKYRQQGQGYRVGEVEPRVGMAVLSSDSKTAGHGYVINAIRPDGKWVVTEANYKGPLTVSNNRVVDPKDPKIIGLLNTVPKPAYQVEKATLGGIGSALKQTGPLGNIANAGLNAISNMLPNSVPRFQMQEKQTSQEPQGIQLTKEQIQAIDSLPADKKELLINNAPEVYSAYVQAGGGGGASQSEIRQTRKEVYSMPIVKNFQDLSNTYQSLDSAYQAYQQGTIDKGIVDQGLVMMFNKMLDPTSAVREGEYARTAEGQSAITRAQEYFTQLQQGGAGITDKTRADMVNLAKQLQNVAQRQFNEQMQFYVDYAPELGTTPQNILGSYYRYYQQPGQPQMGDDISLYQGASGGGGMTTQSDLDYYNSL